MAHRICPPWVGYLLLNPLRNWIENPDRIVGPLVREGMTVLEPGCGMGYFTLPLARMVGPSGRVVATEIQKKMLSVLARRAQKAGLMDRLDLRHIGEKGLDLLDLSSQVDFIAAIHMVHEVSDQRSFFETMWECLKPEGTMLVLEPKVHTSREEFTQTLETAKGAGFGIESLNSLGDGSRKRILIKRRNNEKK